MHNKVHGTWVRDPSLRDKVQTAAIDDDRLHDV